MVFKSAKNVHQSAVFTALCCYLLTDLVQGEISDQAINSLKGFKTNLLEWLIRDCQKEIRQFDESSSSHNQGGSSSRLLAMEKPLVWPEDAKKMMCKPLKRMDELISELLKMDEQHKRHKHQVGTAMMPLLTTMDGMATTIFNEFGTVQAELLASVAAKVDNNARAQIEEQIQSISAKRLHQNFMIAVVQMRDHAQQWLQELKSSQGVGGGDNMEKTNFIAWHYLRITDFLHKNLALDSDGKLALTIEQFRGNLLVYEMHVKKKRSRQ